MRDTLVEATSKCFSELWLRVRGVARRVAAVQARAGARTCKRKKIMYLAFHVTVYVTVHSDVADSDSSVLKGTKPIGQLQPLSTLINSSTTDQGLMQCLDDALSPQTVGASSSSEPYSCCKSCIPARMVISP